MMTRLQVLVLSLALGLMAGYVLHVGRPILVPVVAAVLVVFMINGISGLIGRLPVVGPALPGWGRRAIAAAIMVLALVEVVALFVSNIGILAQRAPVYQQALVAAVQNAAVVIGIDGEPSWDTIRPILFSDMDLPRLLRSVAASATSVVGVQIFVLLNIAFLLLEQRTFHDKIARLSPDPERVAWLHGIIGDVNARVSRYLAIKTLLNGVLGALSWAVMAWFGVEFAALWAMLIAILNYIPYFGSFIGVAFPVAVAIAQFGDLETILWLVAALAALQFLIGNVLEPQVMGNSLNLSPWVILVSLAAWASLWGVAGAVFSVPITAILVVIFSEFERTRPLAVLLSRDGRLRDG